MSQIFFISQQGKGGPLTPEQREKMEALIRTMPTCSGWDEEYHCYCFNGGRWNSLSFTEQGILLQISGWDDALSADIWQLVKLGRTMGLTMFGDGEPPGDEIPWRLIEKIFGIPSPPSSE